MEETVESIDTGKALVAMTENDLVTISVKDEQELELEDVMAINAAKEQLVGDRPYTVLFRAGAFNNISHEARVFSASPEVYKNAIAKAILADSLPARIIGDFFIRVNRPPAPTRLFKNEEEAREWLRDMMENKN